MAIKSGFFNSVNGDRKYNANRFAEYFATFIGNGVFPNPSDNLQVVANDDMTVTVKAGKAWINGYIIINDDDYILDIEPADGVLSRIDRIVARYGVVDREIRLEARQGNFASSPVAPTLQRDADAYELGIANILVSNGVISISQSNITDLRLNTELCGIVHGTVDQVDTTSIFNQYQAWFNSITDGTEQQIADWQQQQHDDFMIWFQSIQDILEGDVPANLASRITSLENDFMSHKAEKASSNDFGHVKIGSGLDVQDGLVNVSDTFLKGVFDVGDKIAAFDTTLVDTNSIVAAGVVLKTFRPLASGRVLVNFIGQNTAVNNIECQLWIVKMGSAAPPVGDRIILTYNETLNIKVELDVTSGEQYQLRGRSTGSDPNKILRVSDFFIKTNQELPIVVME